MGIIEFNEIERPLIWGGNKLARSYGKPFDENVRIGESLEISPLEDNVSIVKSGKYKGLSLNELFKREKSLFGVDTNIEEGFPLLIKIIDATDKLSIQVHPDEKYAKLHHNKHGKTEIWYVIDCNENSRLLIGLKDNVSPEDLAKAMENKENIEKMFNFVNIKPNDCFYIKPGTIHAILEGVVIAEIQTPSDVTYRLYDWLRVDDNGNQRELHVTDAFNVIKDYKTDDTKINKVYKYVDNYKRASVVNDDIFSIAEINLKEGQSFKGVISKKTFNIIMFLHGSGSINASKNEKLLIDRDKRVNADSRNGAGTHFALKAEASVNKQY